MIMVQHECCPSSSDMLITVCKLLRVRMHEQMDASGIHRGQCFVLIALWEEEGLTHSELAQRLHVQPATISVLLKRMARDGLVDRRVDPKDQRVSRVYLTDTAQETRGAVLAARREIDRIALAGLDADELGELSRLLGKVQDNLMRTGSV